MSTRVANCTSEYRFIKAFKPFAETFLVSLGSGISSLINSQFSRLAL